MSRAHAIGAILVVVVGCSDSPGGGDDGSVDSPVAIDAGAADSGADAAAVCPAPGLVDVTAAAEVTVGGDVGSAMGIFDPSVVYPGDAPAGAMAYSSVPTQETIRTRVAVSADGGAGWTYAAEINVPEAATLPSSDANECPGGACSGNLISEVSSLIYDADDPVVARRWKLFAHRYLVGAGVALHYRMGTIALQTAGAVEGPWTPPQKHIGWTSPAPYSSSGVVANVSTLAGMGDCLALTEPSAMWLPGSIHLALGCVYIDGGVPLIRVELLRSTDHAASWQRVGTLLRPADAACLTPGASINAAELFAHAGTVYVAATPSDNTGYHGCLVYPVDDLATAQIRRDPGGTALPARTIAPSTASFAGACAFSAGGGGYIMPAGFFQSARRFRIVRTGIAQP